MKVTHKMMARSKLGGLALCAAVSVIVFSIRATAQSISWPQLLASSGSLDAETRDGLAPPVTSHFDFLPNTTQASGVEVQSAGSVMCRGIASGRIDVGTPVFRHSGKGVCVDSNGPQVSPSAGGASALQIDFRTPVSGTSQVVAVTKKGFFGGSMLVGPVAHVRLYRIDIGGPTLLAEIGANGELRRILSSSDYRVYGDAIAGQGVGSATSYYGEERVWIAPTGEMSPLPGPGTHSISVFGGSTTPGGIDCVVNTASAGTLQSNFDLLPLGSLATTLPSSEHAALHFPIPTLVLFHWRLQSDTSLVGSTSLTFGYDPEDLASGVVENDLELYSYDAGAWSRLNAGVDTTAHTISAVGPGLSVIALGSRMTGVAQCVGFGVGAACPCGNYSSPASGAGCLNSLGSGGRLFAEGMASLSVDTFVLRVANMVDGPVLYFQGTAIAGGGSLFGDGLLCTGGAIVRLSIKTNVGGSSFYPEVGDPQVSVQGLVAMPGTRAYQAWYRDAAPFCSSPTFNLSNAWQVSWTP